MCTDMRKSWQQEIHFSDLNNLEVVTITANKYEPASGVTETEVFFDTGKHPSGKVELELDAYVIEFKMYNPRRDSTLEDTVLTVLIG